MFNIKCVPFYLHIRYFFLAEADLLHTIMVSEKIWNRDESSHWYEGRTEKLEWGEGR